jgi:hypothetical protein
MTDLLKLILGVLASLFRSEHCWRRRKIWSCGSKSMCFAGRHQSGRTSTILIVFCLFGAIARRRPEIIFYESIELVPLQLGSDLCVYQKPYPCFDEVTESPKLAE